MKNEHGDEKVVGGVPANTEEGQVSAQPVTEAIKPIMPLVSYDDFAKLHIKIGTIISAELVSGADKLLRLTVEVGEESPRQIVSGIREWFPEPEVLVGKQCPFLVNLEPRIIRGLESQGMILAIGDGKTFSLLHPTCAVMSGAVVR
jgi:methionyl-tRNA synthetase